MSTNPEIETANNNAHNMLRAAERDIMNARNFDATKHRTNRAAAVAALAALESAQADHPSIVDIRQRLDKMALDADTIVVDAVKQPIEGYQRAADREVKSFEENRERRAPGDLNAEYVADKQAEWATKIRGMIEEARPQLTSAAGLAYAAEVDAWIAAVEQRAADLRVIAEGFALFQLEAEILGGQIHMVQALDSTERNLSRDPERTIIVWDGAKKLIAAFENPRFAHIPEIAKQVARYRELEPRIASELRPALAKVRVKPLIDKATYSLDLVKRDTDNMNPDNLVKWRKKLREEILPLERDWADNEDAQDFLSKCTRALRRCDEDLPQVLKQEVEEVESYVKPLVERVELALALRSRERIVDHAPRLRVRLAALAPFLGEQRARLLHDRAVAALGRIAGELGADVARAVDEAEAVPQWAIDVASDSRLQAKLAEINKDFATIAETYESAQAQFEENVDLVNGTFNTSTWYGNVESAVSTIIRFARNVEEKSDELKKLDRNHPAVEGILDAVPRIVKRAQQWKAKMAKKAEYAGEIEQARCRYEDTRHNAEQARTSLSQGTYSWPEVLKSLSYCDEKVEAARAVLPDEHEEADAWAAKAAALRKEASEGLIAGCIAEVTKYAVMNAETEAERYADILRDALPDAPENAQIAQIMSGTADARLKAQAEIQEKAALICRRAEEAARNSRDAYDRWAEEMKPIVVLGGTIVNDLERYKGKYVAGHCSHLGIVLPDEPDTLNGDIYQIDYDPAVREQLFAGMKRMNDLYSEMAEKIVAAHGVSGVATTNQHYPRDAHYLCEIVGTASYTPIREIKDNYGRLLGTVEGNPYPVPRVVIRGVATTYFVIVPGQPFSMDAFDADGIVG